MHFLSAMATESYVLEKMFWTDADFDRMGWHDNPIHAVAFGPGPYELSFDIDYIFKWEQPLPGEVHYRFWISPATLVFEDVLELKVSHDAYAGLIIADIQRRETPEAQARPGRKLWSWTVDCVEGVWQLTAAGYRQCIRKPPVLWAKQHLDFDQRGGYNLLCAKS
jgi:hypothetical protein